MSKSRTISIALTSLLAAVGLVACASPSVSCTDILAGKSSTAQKSNEVALVIAPTTSFVDLPRLISNVKENVRAALGEKESQFSVILADGAPSVTTTYAVEIDGKFEAEIAKEQGFAIQKADHAYSCAVDPREMTVTDPIATEPELDLMESLRMAADSFDPKSPDSIKKVVVLSNGLQTAGQYQMQSEGIPALAEINSIVKDLASAHALPDLHGATVDFVGLGHVSIPENRLNQQSVESLEAFWTAVVEASNGHIGTILREVEDNKQPSEKAIGVTPVAKQKDACISAVVTEDDGARFTPGRADFVDPAAAKASAQKIADQLAKKPDCTGTLTVTGYVASAMDKSKYVFGNADDANLSLARARAFQSLLAAAGVKAQMVSVGGGKGPYSDWDGSGKYIESLGKKNRIVSVTQ